MRKKITPTHVSLWLSARETQSWADRPGACWSCSTIAGRSLFVQFDSNGLVDLTTRPEREDIDGNELSAIAADHLRDSVPRDHALHFVIIGQFEDRHAKT